MQFGCQFLRCFQQYLDYNFALLQVFSALTMLLPALHGYALAPEIALDAYFPSGNSACVIFRYVHCFFV